MTKKIVFFLLILFTLSLTFGLNSSKAQCPDGYTYRVFPKEICPGCTAIIKYCYKYNQYNTAYEIINEYIELPYSCAGCASTAFANLADYIIDDLALILSIPPCDEYPQGQGGYELLFIKSKCWKSGIHGGQCPTCYNVPCGFDSYCIYDYFVCAIPNTNPPLFHKELYLVERVNSKACPLLNVPEFPILLPDPNGNFPDWESECFNGGCPDTP